MNRTPTMIGCHCVCRRNPLWLPPPHATILPRPVQPFRVIPRLFRVIPCSVSVSSVFPSPLSLRSFVHL